MSNIKEPVATNVTPIKSKFKNSQGVHLLKTIFYELDDSGRPNAQYTLKPYDSEFGGVLYPSLRRLYVELEDPTEYLFAETYLDGWTHWKKVSSASFFQEYLKDWREELEIRLRAKALVRIKGRAEQVGSKDGLAADKILLSGGWRPNDKSDVGRPTKEKIQEEADKLFKERTIFDEDHERIFGGIN